MTIKSQKNIIVADDDFFFRTRLSDILTEAGYGVRFASDGNEAIAEIKANHETIDLLILDLEMPNLNGFGVLKWINDNGFKDKMPVLVLTGAYESGRVSEELGSFGVHDFLPKDFLPDQIVSRVNGILGAGKGTEAADNKGGIPGTLPVEFFFKDTSHAGYLANITETGAFLHTKVELLKGDTIRLKFSLPKEAKVLDLNGAVSWCTYTIQNRSRICWYGISFNSVSEDDRKILRWSASASE